VEHTIAAVGLGKRFRRHLPDRARTIQEAVVRSLHRAGPTPWFCGLRNVTFQIAPGSMIGVIGRNGAGKSTMLRLIGGIGRPDDGTVTVRGQISGLLNLGVGFHGDLTGRENVFVEGVIGGLWRRDVAARFDAIIDFAEVGDLVDSPLRTYSTGMQMRLAFAVAIHTEPDVLLIDEVLAVGDHAFQRKCVDRIRLLKARGCTIVLVSHDSGLVGNLCDEVLWLESGQLVAHGPADEIVSRYSTALARFMRDDTRSTPEAAAIDSGATIGAHHMPPGRPFVQGASG
jgi:lipopolysaccharide transport system ATP-binding protein